MRDELLAARFLRCVRQLEGGCWEHENQPRPDGYCQVAFRGKPSYVHRVAFELLVGAIPEGFEVGHLCFNRACCNPAHLGAVLLAENRRRRLAALATHCRRGHEWSAATSAVDARGRRRCRACRVEGVRRWRAAHPEAARELDRRSYEGRREAKLARGREWVGANRAKVAARQREYQRARRARERARRLAAGAGEGR